MPNKIVFLIVALGLTACFADTPPSFSDVTLVSNAKIYTSDAQQPTAKSFAFRDEVIIAVGDALELKSTFPGAKTLDLNGKTVIPGLIDAHAHLLSLGLALGRVDLVGSTTKEEILQRLTDFEAKLPPGQWLLGRGWDQNDWPEKVLPTAADLDATFPERPIWLTRIDGHAGWANSAAMAFAKQDLGGSWQPDGGEIVRDDEGNPTGIFIDNAEALIAAQIPQPSATQLRDALQLAMQKTASVGLTSVHDAGTSKQVWDILNEMRADGELDIRFYAMADGNDEMLDFVCENGGIIDDQAMLTARAVKLYSDGALGSRGAALLAPYSDRQSQSGLLIESPATLAQYAKRAADCNLQVNIHAIGDRGNRVTLDAMQAARVESNPGRHRVEHSQIVAPDDFTRFKQLGLIASIQPTHATSDMYWAEDRVGSERIKGAYAWQKFIELGVPLALGSDFPVEKADPILGFFAAVTRQDTSGWPADGWYADQKLSRQQALHGFTLGAAYAAFQEERIGSIETGKFADFVVLSQDIMQVPEAQIPRTRILATYLNGQAIFSQ